MISPEPQTGSLLIGTRTRAAHLSKLLGRLKFRKSSTVPNTSAVKRCAAMRSLVTKSQARQLLHNKFVVILGGSVQRSMYKDLVVLLQRDQHLTLSQLKSKAFNVLL
ncbi:hypothetical protein ATANTOWER_001725 [Ataeniobius toweri]|uniref:Uncharacterized protein n=1 Tax=Ataeniobius toweri TaxID=208326 RepID=A0ABU7BDQ6_9TELE|nr:hypothetical protein [Ataeniobius toweri]